MTRISQKYKDSDVCSLHLLFTYLKSISVSSLSYNKFRKNLAYQAAPNAPSAARCRKVQSRRRSTLVHLRQIGAGGAVVPQTVGDEAQEVVVLLPAARLQLLRVLPHQASLRQLQRPHAHVHHLFDIKYALIL